MPDDASTDPLKQARSKALDLLARREHAADELLAKLVRKGIDADAAADAVAELADEGLQSDERYAESVVAARVAQGKGPLHILHGLKQCGVSSALAEQALAEAGVDWFERALRVRRKRFGDGAVADAKEHGRQMRFLLQRGFTAEQAHDAVGADVADFDI